MEVDSEVARSLLMHNPSWDFAFPLSPPHWHCSGSDRLLSLYFWGYSEGKQSYFLLFFLELKSFQTSYFLRSFLSFFFIIIFPVRWHTVPMQPYCLWIEFPRCFGTPSGACLRVTQNFCRRYWIARIRFMISRARSDFTSFGLYLILLD